MDAATSYLVAGGALVLEIGEGQGGAVSRLFSETGQYDGIEVTQDLAGLDRIFFALRAE